MFFLSIALLSFAHTRSLAHNLFLSRTLIFIYAFVLGDHYFGLKYSEYAELVNQMSVLYIICNMPFFLSPSVIFSWSVIQLNKCGTNSRWQRHQFEIFADDYEKMTKNPPK